MKVVDNASSGHSYFWFHGGPASGVTTHFLPTAFTSFKEKFSFLKQRDTKLSRLLEERKQKGIIIDAARTSWLRTPCQQEHIHYFLQERIANPSHRTLAKRLWLRDEQKRAEGWIPVLVQGVSGAGS
eukprot:g8123.t1